MKKHLIFKREKLKDGVALLFSVVVSMILFTILAGVLSVSMKEAIFSISIKNSNNAFYIADSAIECTLFNDKSDDTVFVFNNSNTTFSCFNNSINVNADTISFVKEFKFNVNNQENNSCAKVSVVKTYDPTSNPSDPTLLSTKITSKGYNNGGGNDCDQTNLKSVERVLEVTY